MTDLDPIYELLRAQGETLARIDERQQNTSERLFGANGQPGALHFLQTEIGSVKSTFEKDLGETNAVVAIHGSQINFWRGALAVITVLFTAMAAWAGVIIGKHR